MLLIGRDAPFGLTRHEILGAYEKWMYMKSVWLHWLYFCMYWPVHG